MHKIRNQRMDILKEYRRCWGLTAKSLMFLPRASRAVQLWGLLPENVLFPATQASCTIQQRRMRLLDTRVARYCSGELAGNRAPL